MMLENVIESMWPLVDLEARQGDWSLSSPLPVLGMYILPTISITNSCFIWIEYLTEHC